MMRKRISMCVALCLLLGLALMPHVAQAGCGYQNDGSLTKKDKTASNDNGDVNTVKAGTYNQYTVTFPDNGPHYVMLVGAGDLDLTVCSGNGSATDCHSENPGGVDGCAAEDLEGNPGIGNTFTGSGPFKIQVRHCFGTVCGYPSTSPAPDPYTAQDLPYAIVWM